MDMSMSEVTVVIPCFNHGEFVCRAAESVLKQEGVDVHIILIDDGSDDKNTIAKIDELGGSQCIKVIRTENRGVASARNIGISEAKGDYICFLDADDRLLPDALKTLSDTLNDNPRAALAYPAFKCMSTGECVHRPAWNPLALLYTNTLSITSLVRRSAVGKARFRTTKRGFEYEDWDFWLQITENAPAMHVPKALYEYRARDESRCQKGNNHHREVIEDLRKFNQNAYLPETIMSLKRKYCPAVSIIVDNDSAYEKWSAVLDSHPYLDAELLHAMRIPRMDIDRRERILGKYILRDQGKTDPDYEVFASALKAFENFEHLYYLPEGWAFSLRQELGLGLDPTSRLALQFAAQEDVGALSQYEERLWRLSCPAWFKSRLPLDPDEAAGENGRATSLNNMLNRLDLIPYAFFGAGRHTKRIFDKNIFDPKPKIIFDDDPKEDAIGGVPVSKPENTEGINAIIISSDAHERTLYKRALEIFPSDIPILRFYS